MELRAHNHELPLADLLQVLHQNQRTALVRVGDGLLEGDLHIERGEVVDANFGELSGEPAVWAILGSREVAYEVLPVPALPTPRRRSVRSSLTALLMSSAQAVDEQRVPDAMHGVVPVMPHPSSVVPAAKRSRGLGFGFAIAALGLLAAGLLWTRANHRSEAAAPPVATAALPAARMVSEVPRHKLMIKGSDTIGGKLAPAWGRAFSGVRSDVSVQVEALGSATAFAALCDGTAEVGTSSRTIRAEENELARTLGITLREYVAGYDGIAVIVHPDSRLTSLDLDTAAAIFAGRITRWSELGGIEAPIHVLGRPSYSGTHSFFRERVLSRLGKETAFGSHVREIEASEDIIASVKQDPLAIAYVSAGWVKQGVRTLPLASSKTDKPVALSDQSVRSGSYPVSRALLLYLRGDAGEQARAFVRFALSAPGQALVSELGFVPAGASEPTDLARDAPAATAHETQLVRVYFTSHGAHIDADSARSLASLLPALRSGRRALLVGNADSAGNEHSNEWLARARAKAVADYFAGQGIAEDKVIIQAGGVTRPLSTNQTSQGRRENRRVDVFLLDP